MLAPADAPRSENLAFGRPRVKRRAGLSSSSVVGLIAVSIRAIFYVRAAPAAVPTALRERAVLPHFPERLRKAAAVLFEPLRGAPEDVTDRSIHPISHPIENPNYQDRVEISASSSP